MNGVLRRASLGWESFLVDLLADGKITNILSPNHGAAASGEFFVADRPHRRRHGGGHPPIIRRQGTAAGLAPVEIDHLLRVMGAEGAVGRLHGAWRQFARAARSLDEFHAACPRSWSTCPSFPPHGSAQASSSGRVLRSLDLIFIDAVRNLYAA